MNCPKCGGRVLVHGSFADDNAVRRRRVCEKCHYTIITAEYEVTSEDERQRFVDLARADARYRMRKHRMECKT